jgi:hypothetical protein
MGVGFGPCCPRRHGVTVVQYLDASVTFTLGEATVPPASSDAEPGIGTSASIKSTQRP